MKYPKLLFDLKKLKHNIDVVGGKTHQAGCSLMIVTKSLCADPEVRKIADQHPMVDYLADSRTLNLREMHDLTKPKVLLRIPQESELDDVVKFADISFQSEAITLAKTNEAAGKQGVIHKVVLMIDLGDLREGIFFEDKKEIMDTARLIVDAANLELYGIGTNLTCYGAIIPKEDNLSTLVGIAKEIENELGIKLKMISGGNSSSYYLAEKSGLPEGINNLRLGESFFLGNDTAYGDKIKDTYNDAIVLKAQIVELKSKPSVPIGESGMDAFGNKPVYEDRGTIKRAIVAVGQQDTDPTGLQPLDSGIDILGASSDHLILDVTKSETEYKVGDIVTFTLNFGSILRAVTSKYVNKEYLPE